MEKIIERAKKYEVAIKIKGNGYCEARISIKVGGEKTRRLNKGGKSTEQAVDGLLTELYKYIDEMYRNGLITKIIDDIVVQRLSTSINKLCITAPKTIQKTYEIINLINNINQSFNNIIPIYTPPNNILQSTAQQSMQPYIKSDTIVSNNQSDQADVNYMIEDVAIKWKKYELSLCKKSDDNPRPLSHKTVDGYIKMLDSKILPFLKNKKLLYIHQVNENVIKDLIKNINGYHGKRNVYIICVLFFRYLVSSNIIDYDPMENISKPVKPNKAKKTEIVCIEPENYHKYIQAFEKENTNVSILFETIMYTGLRPEEVCGLKWNCLHLDTTKNKYELIIENAYKKIGIYNENMEKIGFKRQDDTLKTDKSYRSVYIPSELVNQLLKHKENQKQRLKNSIKMKKKGKKWSENEYMFLSRYYKPYVPESLPKPLRQLCDKYGLERFAPYALRRSFATWCFEKGMSETILAETMGHSSFETTHKYYVRVTERAKQKEIDKVFENEKLA